MNIFYLDRLNAHGFGGNDIASNIIKENDIFSRQLQLTQHMLIDLLKVQYVHKVLTKIMNIKNGDFGKDD